MSLRGELCEGLETTLLSNAEILEAKRLEGGEILGLKTWVSDSIRPGENGYQIILKDGNLTMQFPTDWENYSEAQVRDMYDSVNSIEDWSRIRENLEEEN